MEMATCTGVLLLTIAFAGDLCRRTRVHMTTSTGVLLLTIACAGDLCLRTRVEIAKSTGGLLACRASKFTAALTTTMTLFTPVWWRFRDSASCCCFVVDTFFQFLHSSLLVHSLAAQGPSCIDRCFANSETQADHTIREQTRSAAHVSCLFCAVGFYATTGFYLPTHMYHAMEFFVGGCRWAGLRFAFAWYKQY